MPSQQTGAALASNSYNVTISSIIPTLSGYTFKGWCSNSTSNESCSGTSYDAGGTWTVSSNGAILNLYAKWHKDSSCPSTITTCSKGSRQGQRFGNGKCWMSTDYKTNIYMENASCPSGWSVPTQSDFENLISASQAGSGACLHEQGWGDGSYASSTHDTYGVALSVNSTSARVNTNVCAWNCLGGGGFILRCVY